MKKKTDEIDYITRMYFCLAKDPKKKVFKKAINCVSNTFNLQLFSKQTKLPKINSEKQITP